MPSALFADTAHPWFLHSWQIAGWGLLYFAVLYFATGALTYWLTRHALPRIGYGRILDLTPLPAGQLAREIKLSSVSVVIFGVGVLLPWWLLKSGIAQLAVAPSWWQILLEVIALFFWNEFHFYACHRLLHTRWLKRFHVHHHRSRAPTPFSTYSFHPVEALMLGSVPLIPMLIHDFSLIALLSLPVMSIVLNNLGHANYEFSANAPAPGWRAASRKHQLHHAHYHGNYGFLLDWFDRIAGTTLPSSSVKD